jgi:hypothetical protein
MSMSKNRACPGSQPVASLYALGTANRMGSGPGTAAASNTAGCLISTLSNSNCSTNTV